MRSLLAVIALLLAASGCAQPVPSPTMPFPSPVVECSELAAADCRGGSAAALAAVVDQEERPIRIELGRGAFCRAPGVFWNGSCPGGAGRPREGEDWIGHALVTFAGTSAQAYVNIAKDGGTFRGDLITIATPTPSPS